MLLLAVTTATAADRGRDRDPDGAPGAGLPASVGRCPPRCEARGMARPRRSVDHAMRAPGPFLCIASLTTACATPGGADLDGFDEQSATARCGEIERFLATFERRFASGDAAGLSALWAADGDLVTLSGGFIDDRAGVEAFLAEALAGPYRGTTFELGRPSIRVLGGLASVDGRWRVRGASVPDGAPTAGVYSMLLRRESRGEWRVVGSRLSVALRGHTRGLEWPERCYSERHSARRSSTRFTRLSNAQV